MAKGKFTGGRQFGPGNPGRPKGTRVKLGEAFFHALSDDFNEHGAAAIVQVRQEDPSTYIKVVASLMPKEFKIERPLGELSDVELADLTAAVGAIIAASGIRSGAGGGETPAPGGNSLN
jgi:hypothetical protein